MPHAMVGVDGSAYWFTEFYAPTGTSNYSDTNLTAGTSPDKRELQCTLKGNIIPIYSLMREMFGKPDSDFEYFEQSGSYVFGVVIATHEFTYRNHDYIAAIVCSKYMGSTLPTYAQRLSQIENGLYDYKSPYSVSIRYRQKQNYIQADFNKFDYGYSRHSTGWDDENTLSPATQTLQLAGLLGWEDGNVSALLNQRTILFPAIISRPDGNDILTLSARIYKNSNLVMYESLDDVSISEDRDDFVSLNYYDGQDGNFASSGWGFQLYDFLSGYEPPQPPPEYPFEDDYNGGGGGTGDYRDTSDTIPIDGTPTNSAIASGFVNAYLLTPQNVVDFHNYLYSTDFLNNVKRLMNDPIDYILAFMLAPYTPDTSANANITIGGTDSEVSAMRISSGYKTVDCGTITLKEFWGKFYDYNPYTKVQIYLPFIGMRPLDIDDVMSGEVNLKYRIDVLTGACVATISVNNARGTNGAIYNFNGNCHSHIPVSGKNYLETVTNVLSAGVGMAGSIAKGDTFGAVSGAINVVRSAKEQLEHAGELTGATGLLSNFTPFLMVSRPSQSLAQNYNHYRGFISNVTAQLGTLSGYTEVAELVQTNIHCTLDEFEEINELLKEGVYL